MRAEGRDRGWAAGRGSSTSLPGSGLTQVRSGPEGWNQVTSPPGGRLKTRDRGPALSCFGHAEQSVNHENRDSTALIHLLREAGAPRTCSLPSHTPLLGWRWTRLGTHCGAGRVRASFGLEEAC